MEQMRNSAAILQDELLVNNETATITSDLSRFENAYGSDMQTVRPTSVARNTVRASLNTRGKVIIVAYALVVALLGFLLIYNAFSMAAVTASIAATEIMLSEEKASINELSNQLSGLNDENNILNRVSEAGYGPSTTATSGVSTSAGEAITYEVQTNWFDKICDFLASLFGR